MQISDAIQIAEGCIDPRDDQELNEAWQLLIDTGVCWELQGWFGRSAAMLIENGTCHAPGQKQDPEYCDACECTPCDCNWGTDQ
tara:strand:- start:982 stop:1233 length:252 start_codon:yes stop_codon:yes gene_type:complete